MLSGYSTGFLYFIASSTEAGVVMLMLFESIHLLMSTSPRAFVSGLSHARQRTLLVNPKMT